MTQKSKPAHISGKGKFRGEIRYTYPDSGGTHGKAIVKGQFHFDATEGGKVIATFHNPDCNGTGHYFDEGAIAGLSGRFSYPVGEVFAGWVCDEIERLIGGQPTSRTSRRLVPRGASRVTTSPDRAPLSA